MYSPKIEPKLVRKLYLLKQNYGSIGITKPMTDIVKEALDEHIAKTVEKIQKSGGSLLMPDELTGK